MGKFSDVCKFIGKQLLIYSLSSFYASIVVTTFLFKVIWNGTSYISVKPRPTPPSCLNDPALGSHQYVKLKDVKLHYVEAGDKTKPLVIFLHGFPEFWYSWRHQIKELKNDFWTVAVDMRGYGDSDKPSGVKSYNSEKLVSDIEQLIEVLGKSSCILIAHDWGGVVAWYLTIKSPQLVDKLIILNAPHPVAMLKCLNSSVRQFFKSWYIFFFQFPFIPEFIAHAHDVDLIERAFHSHPKGKEVFCPHDIEAYKYAFSRRDDFNGPINYYRSNLRQMLFTDAPRMPNVTKPVLIIWGDEDAALSTSLATMSSQFCDNCVVKIVKGASHWVQQDSSAIVNHHISEFLEGECKTCIVIARICHHNQYQSIFRQYTMRLGNGESKMPPKITSNSQSLVGRVRNHLVSSVSSSASKLSKMPVIYPVIGMYHANNWVTGINRKLL